MAIFRIYSPTLGKREDFATILLNKAITPEISNMQSWNGELRKAKLRLPELVRTNYEISTPLSYSDLVGHWKMNDNAAQTTIADSSVTTNDGTAANNIVSATGKINEAIVFNGTTDVGVVPDNAAYDFTTQMSVFAWINPDVLAANKGIVTKFRTAGDLQEWAIAFTGTPVADISKVKIILGAAGGASNTVETTDTQVVSKDVWSHVGFTYNAGTVIIYINGVAVASTAIGTHATAINNEEVDVEMGSFDGANWFDGDIDDVRIYDGELTATEVSVLYNENNGTEDVTDMSFVLENQSVAAEFTSGDSVVAYNTTGETEAFSVLSSVATGSATVIITAVSPDENTPTGFVFNSAGVPTTAPLDNDFLKVQTPDGFEIINSTRFITSDESERLVAFTKQHIYFWNTVLTNWNLIYTSSAAEATYWDSDEYGDYLVATNNVDQPIQWDGAVSTTFEDMDTQLSSVTSNSISKAKFIHSYRNYIFLGNVTLSDSTELQDHVYTSNIGEGVTAGGWRQDADKDAGRYFVTGNGEIAGGFAEWQGYLIIFKRFSTRKFWFVGGDTPFQQDNALESVGCSAPGSVITDSNENLYFYSSVRSLYEISIGRIDKGLNVTTRNINPDLNILIRTTFIEEYNEIWWAVPFQASSTANDIVIVFKEPGKWEIHDIPVVTFGQYRNQVGYTWNTLPFATWPDWSWDAWTAVDGNAAFPIDLSFDSEGFGYQVHGDYLDDGVAYDSSFVVSTDLADKQALPIKKRINQMFVYVNNEGTGTILIESKRDTETEWQSVSGISGGTINLFGPDDEGKTNQTLRQRIPMDLDAFNYQFRATGTSKHSVIGYEFDFEVVGDR